jgi:hypothetical protein
MFTDEIDKSHLRQGDILSPSVFPYDKENKDLHKIYKNIIGWTILNADCDVARPNKVNFFVFAAVQNTDVYLKNKKRSLKKEDRYSKRTMEDFFSKLIKNQPREFYFLYPNENFFPSGAFIELGFIKPISASFKFKDDSNNEITTYEFLKNKIEKRFQNLYRSYFAFKISDYFGRLGIPDLENNLDKNWRNIQLKVFFEKENDWNVLKDSQ